MTSRIIGAQSTSPRELTQCTKTGSNFLNHHWTCFSNVKIVWKSGNFPCSVCNESIHHCLTFLLLHPTVLNLIYTLIRMHQFCLQKFNLPNNSSVPLFHHPAHKVLHTAFHLAAHRSSSILQSHTKARNTARGTEGLYPERIAALM